MASAPGWYPYRPISSESKQRSWSDLAYASQFPPEGERRRWDGERWAGTPVANSDITAIAECPACARFTGFIDLQASELRRYSIGAYAEGALMWLRPRDARNIVMAMINEGAGPPRKCIECRAHMRICPRCRKTNVAAVVCTCRSCGNQFM